MLFSCLPVFCYGVLVMILWWMRKYIPPFCSAKTKNNLKLRRLFFLWLVSRQPFSSICSGPTCVYLRLVQKGTASSGQGTLGCQLSMGRQSMSGSYQDRIAFWKPQGLAECLTQCRCSLNVYWVTNEWRSWLRSWLHITKHLKERTKYRNVMNNFLFRYLES